MKLYTKRTQNRIDRLFSEFFAAPDEHFLSKEDIRQDVLEDEYANDGSIRQLILEARKVLLEDERRWEIITVNTKGYRLVRKKDKPSP
jgi:DNA-binding winged helix-turn-helix (wHTH) protein